jgi:hypothetical protein
MGQSSPKMAGVGNYWETCGSPGVIVMAFQAL